MQDASSNDTERKAPAETTRQAELAERIRCKITDYTHYKFTVRETRALNIFFDLAQEYEDLRYLHLLPVQILHFFFNCEARLYARDESGALVLQTPEMGPETTMPPEEALTEGPQQVRSWWFFPVKGRPGSEKVLRAAEEKFATGGKDDIPDAGKPDGREILAVLAVHPDLTLTEHEQLFYEKFANRIGFSLHNRLLALKNLEHIDFVRTLVHDIGHNVIVPNLHFKLLMRQMDGKIAALRQLCQTLGEHSEKDAASLHDLCDRIESHYEEISKHFHQSSFFLETLLRQSHFDQGKYVLQRTTFDLVSRVVQPQFERYRLRFEERDIRAEEDYAPEARRFTVSADVGLLSQVVANFLSNAVKYTRETPGTPGLHVRCSVHPAPDHFGEGRHGLRVAVLSSGGSIPENEAGQLFGESFRASNTGEEQGTGHGLYFSRLIIEQHGGEFGYRSTDEGNIFFLVIPADKTTDMPAGAV